MRRTIFIALAVLTVSGLAMAQPAMQGGKHDLGTGGGSTTFRATNVNRVCSFCHTPHQATTASGQDPLWNHTISSEATYDVYDSDTLNASPTDIGGASAGTASVSNLCMSCHDGTVGVGSLYNDPNVGQPDNSGTVITGSALVGTSLADDHPVNFTYDTALFNEDGGLVAPGSVGVPLFAGTVQCASCHDPHDATFTPFLVVTNDDSALCAECHTK